MKLIIAIAMLLPAFAQNEPLEPDGGSVKCNHRPTAPGCPYWCKFHKDDVRCKAAR